MTRKSDFLEAIYKEIKDSSRLLHSSLYQFRPIKKTQKHSVDELSGSQKKNKSIQRMQLHQKDKGYTKTW